LTRTARSINHSKSVNVKQSDRSVGPHKFSYRMVTEEFSRRYIAEGLTAQHYQDQHKAASHVP